MSNIYRTCIVTRQKDQKENLIRFSYDKDKDIVYLDLKQVGVGRGCYIKNEDFVLDQAVKKRKLQYALKLKRNLTEKEILDIQDKFKALSSNG